VRYGGDGEIVVRARITAGRLRVEVVDGSSTLPAAPVPAPLDAEGGRGLVLVEALADRWGVERRAEGKCLWFELAAVPALPAPEDTGSAQDGASRTGAED
jgi:anti-sigma regulatory factor (Ser/Thr protein kinase)